MKRRIAFLATLAFGLVAVSWGVGASSLLVDSPTVVGVDSEASASSPALDRADADGVVNRAAMQACAYPDNCSPPPPPAAPPATCNTTTNSGGQGVTTTVHDVGATGGTFSLTYNMLSVPDQLDVVYEGTTVYSTGGPVSGSQTVSITFGPGTSSTVTVIVTGPNGTLWDYNLGCAS